MTPSGLFSARDGFYSVVTNGSPFIAVVCGALIKAKHICGKSLSVSPEASWDEHGDSEGRAIHAARDWVKSTFGLGKSPGELTSLVGS